VANIGLALLSAAISKGSSASAVEKAAVADPTPCREVAGAGVGTVQAMFIDRLRAGQ
jgi:hypothetical protein